MSVLFAEGFTSLARQTIAFPNVLTAAQSQLLPLYKAGWLAYSVVNGTSASGASSQAIIQADPIFATRNKLNLRKNAATTFTWLTTMHQAMDTSANDKFVIGFMCQFVPTTSSATAGPSICVMDGSLLAAPPANSTATPSGLLCRFYLPTDGVTPGIAYSAAGTETTTSDQLKANTDIHFEIFVETDVQRLRAYANGILILDVAYTGTFKTKNGFGVGMWTGNNANNGNGAHDMIFSNMYVLGVDAVHTGVLGPATRVIETAPATDVDVHFDRQGSFASNAAVMAQMFDTTNGGILTASVAGTYDIYNAPDAVAANAAQVYGAGIKTLAMSMTEGSHALRPAIKDNVGVAEVGAEIPLTIGVQQFKFADMSVNPRTSQIWTPAQLQSVGFGIKLIR